MSISQENIGQVVDCTITVDGTAFQDQTTQISFSGNEFQTTTLAALNGDSFAAIGQKSPTTMSATSIYTDGESTDLIETLWDKHGSNVTIILDTGSHTFTIVGLLATLTSPNLNAGGDMLYPWSVTGTIAFDDGA